MTYWKKNTKPSEKIIFLTDVMDDVLNLIKKIENYKSNDIIAVGFAYVLGELLYIHKLFTIRKSQLEDGEID